MRVNLKRVCKLWVVFLFISTALMRIYKLQWKEPPASGRGTDFRQMRESVEKCWKGQKCVQREGKRLTLVTDLVLITAAPPNKTSQQLTKRKACLLEFSLEHWHDRLQKNGHYESRPSRRHRVTQPCDARMWRMRKRCITEHIPHSNIKRLVFKMKEGCAQT